MPIRAQDRSRSESRRRDQEGRFLAVTHDRLRRVYESLGPRQQDVVELLPLLFHVNHPLLPGYVSQDAPMGVCDYTPSRQAILAARRIVKTYTYEHRLARRPAINGLYLMGSPGTIAYSKTSDLDVWLCHDPELNDAEIARLNAKARLIEAFSHDLGLETHFFVFDAERFKRGENLSLSAESSGSSQHALLLDEFYRSGLLIAGLKPLWWHVPLEEAHRYDEYVEQAIRQRRISARNYVDFGGLPKIPAEEFFGAAVWQLYKSIESPYKSVLKLLLMEAYAAEYPRIGLLSHRYKAAMSEPRIELNDLDPYLAMYRKVEEYLMANHDCTRLTLLRRAFYIKTNEQLSVAADPRQPGWRRAILERLTLEWGWTRADIAHLDRRNAWRIDTAVEERRELVKALQKSYTVLSDFARCHAKNTKITESDLNVLGRRLYAAFERKPNKLELVTRGICKDPAEAGLSLHQISGEQQREQWLLYVGTVIAEELGSRTPLKRAVSLVEVLAWSHFNRLANDQTVWHLYSRGRRQPLHELRKILETLQGAYPLREIPAADADGLSRPPHVARALFFVNAGCEVVPGRLAEGDVLTSNRTDAFRFGGQGRNLVQAVDLVLTTTWEEVFAFRQEGAAGLVAVLCDYLQRLAPGTAGTPPMRTVHCFSNDYAQTIDQRVTKCIDDACRALATGARKLTAHYIVAIEDDYHELYIAASKPYFRVHANTLSLFKALGEPGAGYRQVVFDDNCARAAPLAAIYAQNKRDTIQVFAGTHREKTDLYILDEYGGLYVERQDVNDLVVLFDHLKRFFDNVGRHDPIYGRAETRGANPLEFYQLHTDPGGEVRARRLAPGFAPRGPYLPLRVFADLDSAGSPQFTVFCDDREFSSAEHGGRLFTAIAESVLAGRRSGQRYPIYITHLELSPRLMKERHLDSHYTSHLLHYKKRFEYQLTKALRRDVVETRPPQ